MTCLEACTAVKFQIELHRVGARRPKVGLDFRGLGFTVSKA